MPQEPSSFEPGAGRRLTSWKEVGAYLNCDARSAQRWEKSEGLPVHRHLHSKASSIYAYTGELDRWRASRRVEGPVLEPVESAAAPVPAGRRWSPFRAASAAAIVVVLAVAAMFWARSSGSGRSPASIPKPLTSWLGNQTAPVFAPDGERIAFAWDGERRDNWDIYIMAVSGGTPVRLTENPAADYSPSWSKDGKWIAFLRCPAGGTAEVVLIPAAGGKERVLTGLSRRASTQSRDVDWSPDGRWLAVTDATAPGSPFGEIVAISAETGASRVLARPMPGESREYPAISPDGRTLAMACSHTQGSGGLCLLPLTGEGTAAGAEQSVPLRGFDRASPILCPRWTPDGRDIVFSSMRFGVNRLWRVARDGGEPQLIASAGERVTLPAMSSNKHRLAYTRRLYNTSIWSVADGREASQPFQLIASTHPDLDPEYSPDGNRIAFISERTGIAEIWVSNRDGSSPVQLSHLNSVATGSPRWSPDGTRIAFDSTIGGQSRIYIVDARGGAPAPLPLDRSVTVLPAWSPDGQWIYFCSDRSGDWQIWRAPAAGGEPVQVTTDGGFGSSFSPDGQWLYFTRPSRDLNERPSVDFDRHAIARTIRSDTSVWKMPAKGGAAVLVADGVRDRCFAPSRDGIYVMQHNGSTQQLVFYPLKGGPPVRGFTVPQPLLPGMSVSPDGRTILYGVIDQNTVNLMLLDDYR